MRHVRTLAGLLLLTSALAAGCQRSPGFATDADRVGDQDAVLSSDRMTRSDRGSPEGSTFAGQDDLGFDQAGTSNSPLGADGMP